MKKEKWLLKEIDTWQSRNIIDTPTADILREMYQPKKSIGFLMILFSVVGALLIGMGIILISANNWWYSLPLLVKAFVGFIPLVLSQVIMIYVYRRKMHSTTFRESAAILNMAGVFSSIALVDQIFHLSGDFTNYVLICGLLSLPSMLIMNAVSPLIIYYWTAINGGICVNDTWGIATAVVMFAIGAVYAIGKCRSKNGKNLYLSLITAIGGFVLIFVSSMFTDCELSLCLFGYFALLIAASSFFKGAEDSFRICGISGSVVTALILTYRWFWGYDTEMNNLAYIVITAMLALAATVLTVRDVLNKKYNVYALFAIVLVIIRSVWMVVNLTDEPFDMIYAVVFNLILFALSVFCIVSGAKKIDLFNANIGMITLCTLIVMRFFDSEMPLAARGVVFLVLGVGFLLFNLHLVRSGKKAKEASV